LRVQYHLILTQVTILIGDRCLQRWQTYLILELTLQSKGPPDSKPEQKVLPIL